MNKSILPIATIIIVFFFGCAASIPISSNLNDFIVFGIKPNSNEKVDFTYSSTIKDGKIYAYNKDKAGSDDRRGYEHTEASSMQKIISEYMSNKFPNVIKDSNTKIKIAFEGFHIEIYREGTTMLANVGANVGWTLIAKLIVIITVTKNGQESTKIINGTSEDKYSTGIFASNSNSLEGTLGKNIDNANNKVLFSLNAYFQEIGL